MKLRYILLASGFAFLAALLIQTPAALVYAWTFARQPEAPVLLYGVDGTAITGSALQASRGTQALLRQLTWQWQPSALLLGRAAYHLQTQAPPLLLDGSLAVGLGGTRVSNLKASGELRSLAAMLGQTFVPLTGEVGLQVERLRLSDDWPVDAQGEVRAIGLAWALGREPVALGDYLAVVTTLDGDIVASVSTLSGVIDVGGEARLKPDRSYEFDLKLRPRPDAPPMLANLLRQLGPTDAEGNYHLRRNGTGTVRTEPESPSPAAVDSPAPTSEAQPQRRSGQPAPQMPSGIPLPDGVSLPPARAQSPDATPVPSTYRDLE